MVDMAKVHGLETAREIVRKIWSGKIDGLHIFSDKARDLNNKIMLSESYTERRELRDQKIDNLNKWSQALGEAAMCSIIMDALAQEISKEMNVDSEVLA